MAFTERMKVEHSLAQIILRIEMQKRGLHKRMAPLNSVIIFNAHPIQIAREERVTKDMIKKRYILQFTKPDLLFAAERFPFYLDGPPHRRRGVKNRDDTIDQELLSMGFAPLRFAHNGGKPSTRELNTWADAIEMILRCWDQHHNQKDQCIIWCVKEYVDGRLTLA